MTQIRSASPKRLSMVETTSPTGVTSTRAAPMGRVLLEARLGAQQTVERTIGAVVVDPLGGDAEEVFKGGRPVPVLGDVQLARWLAQTGQSHKRRHVPP